MLWQAPRIRILQAVRAVQAALYRCPAHTYLIRQLRHHILNQGSGCIAN